MCGRYTHRLTWRQIHDLYRLTLDYRPNIEARYNIAPTQLAPIVRNDDGGRMLRMMRWGWEREWAKHTIINATAEKVPKSRVFVGAFEERRCLVPADGFYEWATEGGERRPYRIIVGDEEPFAMAGLWETWTADRHAGIEPK